MTTLFVATTVSHAASGRGSWSAVPAMLLWLMSGLARQFMLMAANMLIGHG